MFESGTWLHVNAAGMELLLPTQDLREVVAFTPVAPLPGRPQGIQGVVVYQGEFLPVLAWNDLPGCQRSPSAPVAMAVSKSRLGIPLDRMIGTVELAPGSLRDLDEDDPVASWMGAVCQVGDQCFRVLDTDRLIACLRRFRNDR